METIFKRLKKLNLSIYNKIIIKNNIIMADNPFLNKKFIKDIKRSFVPSKLFNNNEYQYQITDVNFKYRKNNLIQIIIKSSNGNKYEYTYISSNECIKEIENSNIKNKLKNNMDIE